MGDTNVYEEGRNKMVKDEELVQTLKELDEENKFIYLMTDWYFKKFLKENKIFLCRLINSILNLNVKEEDIVFKDTNLTKSSKNEYNKDVDILLKIGKYIIIDIECNSRYFSSVSERNLAYTDKLYGTCYDEGADYIDIKKYKVYQINLNPCERFKPNSLKNDDIYEMGEKTSRIYTKNKRIALKYLEYFRYLYYTENERGEEVVLLASLTSKSYMEFYTIISNIFKKEELNQIIKGMINNMDAREYWVGGPWSKENYDRIARQKEYEIHEQELIENLEKGIGEQNGITKGISIGEQNGIAIGKLEGIAIGEKNGINTMILNMIKNNISLNDIATISGKSLSKIKKMASSIK